jgi:hypothetical protein
MYLSQLDFVMVYFQVAMKERAFIRFPIHWKYHLPCEYHHYIDVLLLLNKAIYVYIYSGKVLFEEQAEFLESLGFRSIQASPVIWVKNITNYGIIIILQYSDYFLVESMSAKEKAELRAAISRRFSIE